MDHFCLCCCDFFLSSCEPMNLNGISKVTRFECLVEQYLEKVVSLQFQSKLLVMWNKSFSMHSTFDFCFL